SFSEAETEEEIDSDDAAGAPVDGDEDLDKAASGNGDRIEHAQEKLEALKATLLKAKQKLIDLESDAEALTRQHEQEGDAIAKQWTGTKSDLRAKIKTLRAESKKSTQALKERQKLAQKSLKAEVKSLEQAIPNAEYELRVLTTRGKIELLLDDPDLIGTLKERWIAAEVAKRLDYAIFMAVSERGGKNNSGDYEHVIDDQGSLVEFPAGHPQEGQLVVDQDLVNFHLSPNELADASSLSPDQKSIAEAFVLFAQEHN